MHGDVVKIKTRETVTSILIASFLDYFLGGIF